MIDILSQDTRDDVYCVRHGVGGWIRDDYAFVRFEGSGTASWLHALTTNDVLALASGGGHANAMLDDEGRLQAHFSLHRWQDTYWLLTERIQAPRLIERTNASLTTQDVKVFDSSHEVDQLVLQGPRTLSFLASVVGEDMARLLPNAWHGVHPIEILGHQVIAIRHTVTDEDGYLVVTQAGEAKPLLDALLEADRIHGLRVIGEEAREILRVEAGIPRFGADVDATNRLPETTLERSCVCPTKDCYTGKEAIAKLANDDSVEFALVGIELDEGVPPLTLGNAIQADGNEVGTVRSSVYSPTLDRSIALAYLDRGHRAPDSMHVFSANHSKSPFGARVVQLPFYAALTREEQAQALYDVMVEYEQHGAHDMGDKATLLLREAVLLDPSFEKAREMLGAVLSRRNRAE